MPPAISNKYHAHPANWWSERPGENWMRYIVIHNTGNSAPALNEAKYAANNAHGSSFHYVLDGGGAIYQTLEDSNRSWSVGGWDGTTQYYSNAEVISIEVCSNGDRFTAGEIEELAYLVPLLMERHGIDAAHVVRHYDCHSGRKRCPAAYCGTAANDAAWKELKTTITEGETLRPVDVWAYANKEVNPDYIDTYDMLTTCTRAAEEVNEIAEHGVPVSIDLDTLADKTAARIADQVASRVADILAARLKD